MSNLKPLNIFSENIDENWKQFKNDYDKFEVLSGLARKSDKARISNFLSEIGEEAANIYLALPMTKAERNQYISVIKAFDTFFTTKNNPMLARFVFENRNQLEGESFSSFILNIKGLIKMCEFSEADFDEMLSKRIILGIGDKQLQEKLLNMRNLTSEEVIDQLRMREVSNQHLRGLTDIKFQANKKLINTKENYINQIELGSHQIMTMKEIKAEMMDRLGLDPTYTQYPKSRDHLLQYEPKREDLPPRCMNDSFTSAIIPLSQDSVLRDSYITSTESIRFGRLMEDMDLFAVWVCHKHLYIPKLDLHQVHLPYTFVTILVDEIKFTNIIPSINNDIRLSGHVSWVGTSSMEIIVWLETVKPDGSLQKITKSLFVMGARNAINTKAAPVNPLKASNAYEESLLENANERQKRRKLDRDSNLLKVLPTQEEQKLMHDNFLLTQSDTTIFSGGHILPSHCVWMDKTKIVDIDIAFPENRNAQNQVFGGFLMRKALENSIISASLYAGSIPRIKYISDIIFHKPVEVTTILRTTTYVTYTEERNIQLMCITETRTQKTDFSVTNVFHYTYESDVDIPKILPKTYQEAIWNLVGRREFLRNKRI